MPKARGQPEDVKQIIVKAFQRGKKAPEIAEIVNVSERTVRRLWTYTRKYGVPSRPSTGPLGRPVKMDSEQVQAMLAYMIQHNYTFWIKDLFEHLKEHHGWTGCEASVRRKIVDLGFRKKEPWHKSQMTVWDPPEQPVLPPTEEPDPEQDPESGLAAPEGLLAPEAHMLDPEIVQAEDQLAHLTEHSSEDQTFQQESTDQQPHQQAEQEIPEMTPPDMSSSGKKSTKKGTKTPVQPAKLPAMTPMAGSTTCGEDHLRLQVKALQHELAQSKHQVLSLQRELGRYIAMQQAHLASNQAHITYQSPYMQDPSATHHSPYHTDPSASHQGPYSSAADPSSHQGPYQTTTDTSQTHTSPAEANMFHPSYQQAAEAAHPSQYQPAADMGYASQLPTGPEMGHQSQYQAAGEMTHHSPYQAVAEELAHQSPFMTGHEETHG